MTHQAARFYGLLTLRTLLHYELTSLASTGTDTLAAHTHTTQTNAYVCAHTHTRTSIQNIYLTQTLLSFWHATDSMTHSLQLIHVFDANRNRLMLDGYFEKALELLRDVHQHFNLSRRYPASRFPHFSSLGSASNDDLSLYGACNAVRTLILVESFKRAEEIEKKKQMAPDQPVCCLEDPTHQLPATVLRIHKLFENLIEINQSEEREGAKAAQMLPVLEELMMGAENLRATLDDHVMNAEPVSVFTNAVHVHVWYAFTAIGFLSV